MKIVYVFILCLVFFITEVLVVEDHGRSKVEMFNRVEVETRVL